MSEFLYNWHSTEYLWLRFLQLPLAFHYAVALIGIAMFVVACGAIALWCSDEA